MGIQLFSRTVLDKLSEEKTNSKDFYYCLVTLSLHKGVTARAPRGTKIAGATKGALIEQPFKNHGTVVHWCTGAVQCSAHCKCSAYSALLQMRNTVAAARRAAIHCTLYQI